MEFNRQNIRSKVSSADTHIIDEGLRSYMLKVYNYMSSGVLLTGIISLVLFKLSAVTNSEGAIIGLTSIGNALYNSALMWVVMLAPLGVVIYMSFGIAKMRSSKAQTTFWVSAALMGASSSSSRSLPSRRPPGRPPAALDRPWRSHPRSLHSSCHGRRFPSALPRARR